MTVSPMPDRDGGGALLLLIAAAILSAAIGTARSIHLYNPTNKIAQAVANWIEALVAGSIGASLAWEYIGIDRPGLFIFFTVSAAWAGADLLDRGARLVLSKLADSGPPLSSGGD